MEITPWYNFGELLPIALQTLRVCKALPALAAIAITDFPSPRFIFECLATQAIQIFHRAGNPIAEIETWRENHPSIHHIKALFIEICNYTPYGNTILYIATA